VVGRVGRVAHAFIFSSPFRNCGCPVLAFFARAGTMQPNTALRLCLNPVAHVFIVPALCRVRKGRRTHSFVARKKTDIEKPGHPPTRPPALGFVS
jgi:hypothetical protein